jgi:heat shock protein HtpX
MNAFKTALLMAVMMVIFVFVGKLIGGQSGMMIAFMLALVMNFGSYWFSDKIVLKMYGAQEVTKNDYPQLYEIVERLASRAGLPMPRVYVMDNPTPNAFATGRNPQHAAVAVTNSIMNLLNKDELEGVIAHELTHIKNRDILIGTIAATLVGTISMIANMAQWAMIFGGGRDRDDDRGGFGDLILIILAPIIAMLIQMAISRRREFMADEGGAQISGKPLGLAGALDKLSHASEILPMQNAGPASAHMFIVNPLKGKSMMGLFSTHPPIEQRIEILKEIAAGRR